MNQENEPIWNYLDKAATPEERAELERRLAEDTEFRRAYLERQELDQQLRRMEAEQPSLRFAQNIMDRLPDLYRRTIEPLVRPIWVKIFLGSLGLFLAGFLGVAYYAVQTGQMKTGGGAAIRETIISVFSGLPSQVVSVIAALSTGYLGLVLLDRLLKKRLMKKVSR